MAPHHALAVLTAVVSAVAAQSSVSLETGYGYPGISVTWTGTPVGVGNAALSSNGYTFTMFSGNNSVAGSTWGVEYLSMQELDSSGNAIADRRLQFGSSTTPQTLLLMTSGQDMYGNGAVWFTSYSAQGPMGNPSITVNHTVYGTNWASSSRTFIRPDGTMGTSVAHSLRTALSIKGWSFRAPRNSLQLKIKVATVDGTVGPASIANPGYTDFRIDQGGGVIVNMRMGDTAYVDGAQLAGSVALGKDPLGYVTARLPAANASIWYTFATVPASGAAAVAPSFALAAALLLAVSVLTRKQDE